MTQLRGRHILVVEDEAAIAIDLARLLADHGATIVGPIGTVPEALSLIASVQLDCAVLDINLGGESVRAVAETLANAGVPFVFVTGYSNERVPHQYGDRPVLQKPYDASQLVATLAGAIAT
jgi:CheY-like chemotaxis protein